MIAVYKTQKHNHKAAVDETQIISMFMGKDLSRNKRKIVS